MRALRAAPHIQYRRPSGWTGRDPNWYKHSLGKWADVTGVGDSKCALMHAPRAAPHIQHGRPNSWTGRDPNWYKHSLGQWANVMWVDDRDCALMCALRAAHTHGSPSPCSALFHPFTFGLHARVGRLIARTPTPITFVYCPNECLYQFGSRPVQPFGRLRCICGAARIADPLPSRLDT
jgi:hypothetical protein